MEQRTLYSGAACQRSDVYREDQASKESHVPSSKHLHNSQWLSIVAESTVTHVKIMNAFTWFSPARAQPRPQKERPWERGWGKSLLPRCHWTADNKSKWRPGGKIIVLNTQLAQIFSILCSSVIGTVECSKRFTVVFKSAASSSPTSWSRDLI